jgi:hypothetical protein
VRRFAASRAEAQSRDNKRLRAHHGVVCEMSGSAHSFGVALSVSVIRHSGIGSGRRSRPAGRPPRVAQESGGCQAQNSAL